MTVFVFINIKLPISIAYMAFSVIRTFVDICVWTFGSAAGQGVRVKGEGRKGSDQMTTLYFQGALNCVSTEKIVVAVNGSVCNWQFALQHIEGNSAHQQYRTIPLVTKCHVIGQHNLPLSR